MGVVTTQGFSFKLVANDVELDLFGDEEIKVSDNITGLFDLGILPSDFTREISLPGTKKNNAFFQHVYDISVKNPILFSTNAKVSCFLDFGGIYLAQGYLQLNKVNIIGNKFIDSYEVSIYGSLSSFARDINRAFLTDMTASLAQYNHTASLENITGSWDGLLYNGDIVYPFAEYGQKILFSPDDSLNGIDVPSGSLFVQDYKPAIRLKKVWDAIFDTYGFTYTGDFFNQPFLDNVYMICNNQLRYPIFDEVDLETYGQFKIAAVSGSTDTQLIINQPFNLPWFSIQQNPGGNINEELEYTLDYPTKIRGILKLAVKVEKTSVGNGVPQFDLVIKDSFDGVIDTIPLASFNDFFLQVREGYISQNIPTETRRYELESKFNSKYLPAGTYKFAIKYTAPFDNNFTVTIDPDGQLKSSLEVTKVGNVGEGFVMNIGKNMPFGTNGIRLIDFISAVQKKFNLIIYPSKLNRREFIVETFNDWYKKGEVKDFNRFMNLDKPIEVIPANNLAVNELNFGDKLDKDFISQQFNNLANREYGKTYYVDTENFFSQGQFTVETGFASSPLTYLDGTGISGSQDSSLNLRVTVDDEFVGQQASSCPFAPSLPTEVRRTTVSLFNAQAVPTINFGPNVVANIRYTFYPAFGGSQTTNINIVIPFGASTANFTYNAVEYSNFFGNECTEERLEIDCVVSVTNASLLPISFIQSCI
jgi:hypothetical protein